MMLAALAPFVSIELVSVSGFQTVWEVVATNEMRVVTFSSQYPGPTNRGSAERGVVMSA